MLHRTIFSLALAVFVLSACADVGDAPEAETVAIDSSEVIVETVFSGTPLPINPANSSIEWTAAKVTRTHLGGFGMFDGTLYVDGDTVTGVELDIDASSIFSDEERLTNHLKSDEFFDVARWPQARFEATSFQPLPDATGAEGATHTITGTLAMRDQTNQISFPATLTVEGGRISASADFIIDRQLWELTYPGQPDDLIRDDVRIMLNVGVDRADQSMASGDAAAEEREGMESERAD